MKRRVVTVAMVALVASACSTTTNSVRVPKIGVVAKDLERNEYVVLGNTEGSACVEQTCWFGLLCGVSDASGKAIVGSGFGVDAVSMTAEDQAMLQALKAQPEADAVMSPRKSMTIEHKGMLINDSINVCVRVFGKSVRIKTDEEMSGIARVAAPAAPVAPAAPATPAPAADAVAPTSGATE